jgi:hypothetical protein
MKSRKNLIELINEIKLNKGCEGYKIVYTIETGDIIIQYLNESGLTVKIQTCNAPDSSCIRIDKCDKLGTCGLSEIHSFNPNIFSRCVNELLTPEDLEQRRAFEQQKQERKDALERAHNSRPKTCDPSTCEHCAEDRKLKWCEHHDLGTYT